MMIISTERKPTMFQNSSGRLGDRFDSYFVWSRWAGRNADTADTTVVEVTEDTLAEYKATVLPPDDMPAVGFYAVAYDQDGGPLAFAYGEDCAQAERDVEAAR
jgi:hypothetical protein